MCEILDAKYKKAGLRKVMETRCRNLTMTQPNYLINYYINSKIFLWNTWHLEKYPVDFELKRGAKPVCLQPYPAPKVHEEMSKNEDERLFILVVLEVENDSEWGAP